MTTLVLVNAPDYRLTAPLVWRQLDGQWLVYQPRSGVMTVLEPVSALLVNWLESGPAPLDRLIANLAQHTELPDDARMADALASALLPLRQLGLVATDSDALAW